MIRRGGTKPELPTLQLARALADAAIRSHVAGRGRPRPKNSMYDKPTQAVLRELVARGAWLSRVDRDEDGGILSEHVLPDV
jgi:hypothetical protein